MNIFKFSVGSEAKRVAVRCVFAIGVVCWANFSVSTVRFLPWQKRCRSRSLNVSKLKGVLGFSSCQLFRHVRSWSP